MTIERGALEMVVWEDPTSQASWMSAADLTEFNTDKTFISHSVGWIVMEDEDAICIAATVNEPNTYVGQIFRIPKATILSRLTIEQKKAK